MVGLFVEPNERLKGVVPGSDGKAAIAVEYRRASRATVLEHRELYNGNGDRRGADRLADFEEKLVADHVHALDGKPIDPKGVGRIRPAVIDRLLALILSVSPPAPET